MRAIYCALLPVASCTSITGATVTWCTHQNELLRTLSTSTPTSPRAFCSTSLDQVNTRSDQRLDEVFVVRARLAAEALAVLHRRAAARVYALVSNLLMQQTNYYPLAFPTCPHLPRTYCPARNHTHTRPHTHGRRPPTQYDCIRGCMSRELDTQVLIRGGGEEAGVEGKDLTPGTPRSKSPISKGELPYTHTHTHTDRHRKRGEWLYRPHSRIHTAIEHRDRHRDTHISCGDPVCASHVCVHGAAHTRQCRGCSARWRRWGLR